MAEGGGGDDEARHDLVADAQIDRGVIGVVRERHPGGQRDHVAREEREFHPGLALRDPVAHRRNAARHLRGGADGASGGADHLGVALIGLVGRKHVIVGGDDADIGGAASGEGVLVLGHRGIGMGLVAAGQMGAGWARLGRAGDPVQIGCAAGGRAGADTVGDGGNGGVQRHGGSGVLAVAGGAVCCAAGARQRAAQGAPAVPAAIGGCRSA
ncbi:hypothetical protein FALB51S_03423 [Frigidibacter albus]